MLPLAFQRVSGPPPDILDSLIYATIVLFILSVITEKLTQLVRYYPRTFRWIGIVACGAFYIPITRAVFYDPRLHVLSIILLYLFNTALLIVLIVNDPIVANSKNILLRFLFEHLETFKNIRKRKSDTQIVTLEQDKADQEKEVTALSFVVGFVVAYCFNANLFNLFKPALELGWGDTAPFVKEPWYALNPQYFDTGIVAVIGFLLTAFFLAFGSKFFHDLLDTLLQVKNLKRKLNDKETYDIETAAELEEQLQYTQGQIVRLAIQQNKDWLEKLPNFLSLHEGPDITAPDKKVAYLNITDNNISGLPTSLMYTLTTGKKRAIPLKVIPNVKIASVAGKVFNEKNDAYIGSVGIPLQLDNELWLMTCGHVMMNGDFDAKTQAGTLASPGRAKFCVEGTEVFPGTWKYGYQDKEFDIALIQPDDPHKIKPSGLLSDPLEVSKQLSRISVTFKGAVSSGDGYVFADEVEEPIRFANQTVRMKGLLKISANEKLASISKPGDSGAALFTPDNRAVGIIIASNDFFTYAMSLEKILAGWDAKIY
jgi:hypothetical protein